MASGSPASIRTNGIGVTIFDRYLLFRFLSIFGILFASTYGLFVVIDGFTNVDGFQEGRQGFLSVLTTMLGYYAIQSSLFFDTAGSMLSIIAVMVVFALLHRHGEIQPLLAAGIPTYRLLVPIVAGTLIVTVTLMVNQELILPRISHLLQASRSGRRGDAQNVEAVYDHFSHILIGGSKLHLGSREMEGAKFVLSAKTARKFTVLEASRATYHPKAKDRPAGWRLIDVTPPMGKDVLTENGKRWVKPRAGSNDLFVITDISFDQLYNRSRNYKYVSTPDLIRRVKNPAYDIISARGQTLHLHARFMRPLLSVLIVPIVIPLIVRRESRGLVGNMSICAVVMGGVFGVVQLFAYLGGIEVISAAFAARGPVIVTGSLASWLSGIVQT